MTSFLAGLVARGAGTLPQPAAQLRRQPLFPLVPALGGGEAEPDPPPRAIVRPAERKANPRPGVARAAVAAPASAPLPPPSRVAPSAGPADGPVAASGAVPAVPPRATPTAAARVAVREVRRSASAAPLESEPAPSPSPPRPAPAPHSGLAERVAAPAPVRAPPTAAVPAAEAPPPADWVPPAHEPPSGHSERTAEPGATPTLELPQLLVPRPDVRVPRGASAQAETRPRAAPPRIEVRIGRIEVRRPEPAWPAPAPAPAQPPPPPGGFGGLAAARHYVDRLWS